MKLKKIPTSSIILTLTAAAFIVWGVYQFSVYRQGAFLSELTVISDSTPVQNNELIAIKGKIIENEPPTDTLNGIYAQCLVLERTVEMYQYVVDDDKVYMQYSPDIEGNITGRGGEEYINPEFPSDLENAMFFGKAEIDGTDITAGPRVLKAFTDFPGHNLKGSLSEFKNNYGLKPDGSGGYDNKKSEKPQIGDIRITYTAWISDDFEEPLIIGNVSGGVIGSETDSGVCAVDFEVDSPKALLEKNYYECRSNARGIWIVSVILLIIAAAVFFKKNKPGRGLKFFSFLLIIPFVFIALSVPGNADFGDFGGDSDYGGGYDSYDYDYGGYDSYDNDYDYDDNDSYNNYYVYNHTTAEPATTSYYTVSSGMLRETYYYNCKGDEISFMPLDSLEPDLSRGEDKVLAFCAAVIVLSIIIAVARRKDSMSSRYSTTAVKSYVPGASRTDRSELRSIGDYIALDPDFSASEFKEKLSNLYIRLQNAWQKKNLEELRPYLTDAFYAQSDIQLDRYRRNNQTNIIEKIAVLDVNISGWKQESGKDIIIAVIQTRITDFVTDDKTGDVVSGSKTAEKFMTYEWRMERTSGVTTGSASGITVQNCPNCGAAVNINHSAKCEYCGSILTTDTFDWVLSSIKGISQRTSGT